MNWRLVFIAVVLFASCDESRVREGASQFAEHEESAFRVFVTPEGVGNIYDVANPDGFELVGNSVTVASDGEQSVSIGPIEQKLGIRSRTVEPAVGALEVTLQFRNPQIFVPVIIRDGFDVRICRYRVSGSLVTTSGLVTLVEGNGGVELDVSSPPDVEIVGTTVASVEACPLPGDLLSVEELAAALVDYVQVTVAQSAASALRTSPLEVLGLVQGNLQISRISGFDNRRGVLAVEGIAPPRADALALTPEGLVATIDATAGAQRARCAPPVSLDPHRDMGTRDVDAAVVRRFGADFALAVSTSWLQRVAQSATLAGFACRGLENAQPVEQNTTLIDVEDILLDEINLTDLPIGEHVRLMLRPGTLPVVESDAGGGTIEVRWDDLQVDVYGEVHGAWTRLASVVSDLRFRLRPQTPALGTATFDVESIEVSDPNLESGFLSVRPPVDDLQRWTQRTLLLLLEERLELPLPLNSAIPLRVVNAQVRTQDVVYYVRFED